MDDQRKMCHYIKIIVTSCQLFLLMLLLPIQAKAMTFNSSKQIFFNDPLLNYKISTSVTTAEDGSHIRYSAGAGVLHMMHGNTEVLTINGNKLWGYRVDEISTSNPSKKFWVIHSVAGARGIEYEFWVVGQQHDGKIVQYLNPDTVRASGYEPLNQYYLSVDLKGDRLSLTAKDEYMPEGSYYGYQRAYRPAYQVELFWDDEADWFGIDRLL